MVAAALAAATACATATGTPPATTPAPPDPAAQVDSLRHSYSAADVDFMTGMIHHHAQALDMARMAPTHDAGPTIRLLAERIINAQVDEIALRRAWLLDQGEPAPDPASPEAGAHAGHGAAMPGMLTPAQMAELDAARGAAFDRLFVTFMIQHHEGALAMVEGLFATHGAAQGDAVFKLASDIGADQSSEIDRMRSMLRAMMFEDPDDS